MSAIRSENHPDTVLVVSLLKEQHKDLKDDMKGLRSTVDRVENRVSTLEMEAVVIRQRWKTIKVGIRWVGGVAIAALGALATWIKSGMQGVKEWLALLN